MMDDYVCIIMTLNEIVLLQLNQSKRMGKYVFLILMFRVHKMWKRALWNLDMFLLPHHRCMELFGICSYILFTGWWFRIVILAFRLASYTIFHTFHHSNPQPFQIRYIDPSSISTILNTTNILCSKIRRWISCLLSNAYGRWIIQMTQVCLCQSCHQNYLVWQILTNRNKKIIDPNTGVKFINDDTTT